MTWSDLPPVGNRITLQRSGGALPFFSGYRAVWLQSGTAALASALLAARARHPHIAKPTVILPGYGCPDLVAAAEYAGVLPVLVDIGHSDPGYDLAALRAALDANTVAVVAVNFLGIKERLAEIRDLLAFQPHVALIEDNAQWFPEPIDDLHGDFICLSFGRGKPVSLLGGGLLLIADHIAASIDSALIHAPAMPSGLSWRLKVMAYNLLLAPALYGSMSRNPLIKLGQTVFKPLASINVLDAQRQALLTANLTRYYARGRTAERSLHSVLARHPELTSLALTTGTRAGRLLRYPILCRDEQQKERLLQDLRRHGLGVSAMYQQALPDIAGVASRVLLASDLPAARAFAKRLLTLPTHAGVDARHSDAIDTIISA